jgi:uncharacterized protein (DUF433 family)
MPRNPGVQEPASEGASDRLQNAEVPASNGVGRQAARVVHRDGLAYVEGCDVPIWRLEMARRAGSPPAALLKVFPSLTPEGLDLAFAYAQQNSTEIDAPIRDLGLDDIPPEDEEDDEDEYRADLDELFEEYGEVFRRLAQ